MAIDTSYHLTPSHEIENIEARTKAINNRTHQSWIRLIFGIIIALIGLVLFLKTPENLNYIGLMMAVIFFDSSSKEDIKDIFGK
jgi:hypothetical protein